MNRANFRSKTWAAVAVLFTVAAMFASCGEDKPTEPHPVRVTSVTLSKTMLSMVEGATETLTATVSPTDATNKAVTWTTSSPAVATVSNGTVTAVKAGTATLTATADGKKAECAVTVTAAVVALAFTDDATYDIPSSTVGMAIANIDLSPGASGGTKPYTFSATGLPAGIAVSASGVISGTPTAATEAGTAKITVTDSSSPAQSKEITIAYGKVAAKPAEMNYSINASALTHFGSLQTGYAQPDAQTVTVTNTGTGSVILTQPTAGKHEIGTLSHVTIAAGAKATFTVRPKAGLAVGNHDETISINGSSGTTATVTAGFEVTASVQPEPVITSHPSNASVTAGQNATFSVTATGAESYQWQRSGNNGVSWINLGDGGFSSIVASGTKTATLTISNTWEGVSGFQFRCVVTNTAGSDTSDAATLTVTNNPAITSQPVNQSVGSGETATFSITAVGATWYRWQLSDNNGTSWGNLTNNSTFSGVMTATLTITGADGNYNGYLFRCVATNNLGGSGSTNSAAAMLTVTSKLPVITSHPSNQSAAAGETVTFGITATGATSYKWQYTDNGGSSWIAFGNGSLATSIVSGAATATLTIKNLWSGSDGWQLRCVATNDTGSTNSDTALLIVTTPVPVITSHPSNANIEPGGTVTFGITATGATSYQWQYSSNGTSWIGLLDGALANCTISGVTTTTMKITNTWSGLDSYLFRCVATNSAGSTDSTAATLTVKAVTPTAPVITAHPANQSIAAGETATFGITATGATSYQWQFSSNGGTVWNNVANGSLGGSPTSGATTTTLTISNTSTNLSVCQFRCVVSNAAGSTASTAATLTVIIPPVITFHPANVAVATGETATFGITATGATGYQWQYSNNEGTSWIDLRNEGFISGVTTPTLTISYAETRNNGLQLRCVATNAGGSTASDSATLTVTAPPVITSHPANVAIATGGTATFSVTATGAENYQWQYSKNAGVSYTDEPGATGSTLRLMNVAKAANSWRYRCVVSNSAGSINSEPAILTVL